MRNVTYYSGGLVAEFAISDAAFEKFLGYLEEAEEGGELARHSDNDLMTARTILDNFMDAAHRDENVEQGTGEVLAASFIWNFFNTHPDMTRMIGGDIVIVDLDGTLSRVEFASAKDVKFSHEHDHDHDHAHGHVHGPWCDHGHDH